MTVLFLLLLIAFMGFGFLTWYFHIRSRQEERKMLIRQGVNIEEIFKKLDTPKNNNWLLKIGIVIIGLGAAFIFICIMNSLHLITQDAAFPGILCLFGATSLVIAHYVDKREKMTEQPDEIHLRTRIWHSRSPSLL